MQAPILFSVIAKECYSTSLTAPAHCSRIQGIIHLLCKHAHAEEAGTKPCMGKTELIERTGPAVLGLWFSS